MGVVYFRSLAQLARPEQNGTETEQKYTGGVQVIEWQMAELAFRFDGTEQNRNVNVFMPPTVPNCCHTFELHVPTCTMYITMNSSLKCTLLRAMSSKQ